MSSFLPSQDCLHLLSLVKSLGWDQYGPILLKSDKHGPLKSAQNSIKQSEQAHGHRNPLCTRPHGAAGHSNTIRTNGSDHCIYFDESSCRSWIQSIQIWSLWSTSTASLRGRVNDQWVFFLTEKFASLLASITTASITAVNKAISQFKQPRSRELTPSSCPSHKNYSQL